MKYFLIVFKIILFSFLAYAEDNFSKTRTWYEDQLGSCGYETAVIREQIDSSCSAKKRLCSFTAICIKKNKVTGKEADPIGANGVCLLDQNEKCPADPIDCFLKQSFKKISEDKDAITISPNQKGKTSGDAAAKTGTKK